MEDVDRLTIQTIDSDPRSTALMASAQLLGYTQVSNIEVADIYFVSGRLDDAVRRQLQSVLVDPLLQHGFWGAPPARTGVIEATLLPGVTDSVAATVLIAAATMELPVHQAATARRYVITTIDSREPPADLLHSMATQWLSNGVIERVAIGEIEPVFVHASMPAPLEFVEVRDLDDQQLQALNRARGMALDPAELRAIADWFHAAGRAPTDVELETLAQTWSEHCAHKTFRAAISLPDGSSVQPLLVQLRDATAGIDAPFVRSAFVGNAGIISFVPGITIAVKAETHNHPSAIEPFGGANTGVGGVIRDVMGAAHHPIATTDVLCFGPADLPHDAVPPGVIHPRLVREGVVAGVADYGNKIGLPTVAGAVLYDPGFTANPLVFCGCIGVAAERPPLAGPFPGDLVVVLGGRTGRDGLRGATFSSATMDATTGDVAGASVQIGDPITEKLLIDLLADVTHLYTAITDCGAGGLSSAIGEMAEGVGADVDMALAPLKYPGLAPWEIWLSEAQERMVVAVAPDALAELRAACRRHSVEPTVLGTFTGDDILRVRHGAQLVLEFDTGFLHDGRPQRSMAAVLPSPRRNDAVPAVHDHAATLLDLLAHPNIASKEAIIRRYDHEIRGTTVVRPLIGVGSDAPADGVVLAEPDASSGIAIGIGVNPWYGMLDPERMAYAVIDEAMRNIVAVGADPDAVALMDNFSWGDPRRPTTLGDLVVAVDACCRASIAHRAPFVSGKDSLNNEYVGTDDQRHSVPPTLVITAVAHVPDADGVVTPDLKQAGDALVLIGATAPEFGGSHVGALLGAFDDALDGTVPAPDPAAPARYRRLHAAMRTGRIRACHDVSEGGLAVALTEMALGGALGVDIQTLPHSDPTVSLFAESTGRFVCELAAADVDWLAAELDEPIVRLGVVTEEPIVDLLHAHVTLAQAGRAFRGEAQR